MVLIYPLSMVFYEIRILISLFVIVVFLEKSRILDSLLKIFLQMYLGYLFNLPIRINTCYVNLRSGIFQMSGFQILVPDKKQDGRWYYECIVEISFLDVKFYLFNSIISFILTLGYQAYVKTITVDGMKIFIEGYEDPVSGNMSFNLDLIGKEVDKKESNTKKKKSTPTCVSSSKKSSLSEWEIINDSNTTTKVISANITKAYASSVNTSGATVVVNASPVKVISEKTITGTNISSLPASPSMNSTKSNHSKNDSLFSNFTDIVGNFIKEVDNSGGLESYVQKKSEDFTKSIANGSLLQNAKKTIDDALNSAKRTIDEGVNSKITSLHEVLRGKEPIKDSNDLRILGEYLIIRDIQLNVRTALPVSLRHLEKKTLSAKYIRLPLHNPNERLYSGNKILQSAGKDLRPNMKKTSSSNLIETWTTVQSFDDDQDDLGLDDEIYIPLDIKTGIHSAILQHQFERELLVQLVKSYAGNILIDAIDWNLYHSKESDDFRCTGAKKMRSENPFFDDEDE